ncbi:MAG TPA: hypothetical protein PK648_05270 [Verrucomicrobiales bacterium]|nr:hypothetical protein [Verrucomicrobiales bacterium]
MSKGRKEGLMRDDSQSQEFYELASSIRDTTRSVLEDHRANGLLTPLAARRGRLALPPAIA